MRELCVIGCGRVGQTLAKLWSEAGVFKVGSILNSSHASSSAAVAAMEVGQPVANISEIGSPNFVLVATPDDAVANVGEKLVKAKVLEPGTIVFHASGALSSEIFTELHEHGILVASIHPVKTFATLQSAIDSFKGTYCSVEGDEAAQATLIEALQAIGANTFVIDPRDKLLYHSAFVFCCNYLVALVSSGVNCLSEAKIDNEKSLEILKPLMMETMQNIFEKGLSESLTGPIARGDLELVKRQVENLSRTNESLGKLYAVLGQQLLELTKDSNKLEPEVLSKFASVLKKYN